MNALPPDPATAPPRILTLDEFRAESAPYWTPPPYVSKYGRVKFCDVDLPGPEHEYIIDKLISVGDKSVIGGPSMSGKSFFALHAAMSIARGVDFFGYKVMRPGLVVYEAGEGARGLKKRIRAYRQHNGIPAGEDLPFDLLTHKVDLYSADGDTKGMIEECLAISRERDMPIRAIFIDTLATASGQADENSGKDMAAVMGHIDEIERATGAHVCLVHHFNAAGTKLRGHSSILANIDQVIQVTCNEETKVRTAVLAKQKDGEGGLTIKFELMSVTIGTRLDDGERITSCVVLPVGEKEAARKADESKGFQIRPKEEPIFRALLNALKASGVFANAEMEAAGVPSGTVAVSFVHWREEFKRVAAPDSEGEAPSNDAIRKHWERWCGSLQKYGVIGWSRPWIWWTGKAVRGFPETRRHADEERTRGGRTTDDGWTGGGQQASTLDEICEF